MKNKKLQEEIVEIEKVEKKIAEIYLRYKYGKHFDAPMWRSEGNRFAQEILSLLKKE